MGCVPSEWFIVSFFGFLCLIIFQLKNENNSIAWVKFKSTQFLPRYKGINLVHMLFLKIQNQNASWTKKYWQHIKTNIKFSTTEQQFTEEEIQTAINI